MTSTGQTRRADLVILLHTRSKGSRIWLFGIGVSLVVLVLGLSRPAHFPRQLYHPAVLSQ